MWLATAVFVAYGVLVLALGWDCLKKKGRG